MKTQYVAAKSSTRCRFEAFESHEQQFACYAYALSRFSVMVLDGYTQVANTSKTGQVRDLFPHLSVNEDRRHICPILSKAFWHSAWLSSSRPVHNKLKKNSSWLIRSRPTNRPPSTEPRLQVIKTGQAFGPAPNLRRLRNPGGALC